MKRLYAAIFALCLATGCAPAEHQHQVAIQATFQPYYAQFQSDAAATLGAPIATDDIIIRYAASVEIPNAVSAGGNGNGLCVMTSNSTPLILIDAIWFTGDVREPQRQALVYHELGHCLLGRAHDEATAEVSASQCYAGSCWPVTVSAYISFMNHAAAVTSLTEASDPLVSHQALVQELFLNADRGPMR